MADAAAQRDRIDRAHILAFDRDAAAISVDQPVCQSKQRGLAGAGAADDGEELALGDIERDLVESTSFTLPWRGRDERSSLSGSTRSGDAKRRPVERRGGMAIRRAPPGCGSRYA
jgi:hypothetical protein